MREGMAGGRGGREEGREGGMGGKDGEGGRGPERKRLTSWLVIKISGTAYKTE